MSLRRLTDVSAPKDVSEILHVRRLLQKKRRDRLAQGGTSAEEEVHLSVGRRVAGTDLVLRSQVRARFCLDGEKGARPAPPSGSRGRGGGAS